MVINKKYFRQVYFFAETRKNKRNLKS
jgi:hypothetical protein